MQDEWAVGIRTVHCLSKEGKERPVLAQPTLSMHKFTTAARGSSPQESAFW